jgi:hypothetical protein
MFLPNLFCFSLYLMINLCIIRGCGQAPWSSFVIDTHATSFEHGYPSVHTLLQWNSVSILCWKSAMDFCFWYTFSPQKSHRCMLLFFGAYGKRGSHVNSTVTTVPLACKVWAYFMNMKGVLTLISAAFTTSLKISHCEKFLHHCRFIQWSYALFHCVVWYMGIKMTLHRRYR